MLARASAFGLLAAAALADSSGAHSGAFFFLLAALPVLVVDGLMAFGDLTEARGIERKIVLAAQAFLSFLTLALAIIVVASGSGPLLEAPLPLIGASALGVCLGLFAVQALARRGRSGARGSAASDRALCSRRRRVRHRRAHRALTALLSSPATEPPARGVVPK